MTELLVFREKVKYYYTFEKRRMLLVDFKCKEHRNPWEVLLFVLCYTLSR